MVKEDMDLNLDLGAEEEEEYLVPGSIVEVLYGFSWKAAIIFATPNNDDDDDCFLVRLLGDEFGGFCAVKDVQINKFLIRKCRRKVVREWLTCLLCVCEKADDDEEEEDDYQCQEENCGSYIVYAGKRRRGAKRSKLPSHTHCSPLKKPRKEEEEEAVEEEERRRRLLVYILSLPRSRRTWLWDNEIEKYTPSRCECNLFSGSHVHGSSDHNLPSSQPVMGDKYITDDESYSSGCASSSVASCSTSTQNVSTCGCVKDIDRDSDYYFSDAESSC